MADQGARNERNVLVDVLRGVCHVFITMDHLPENILSRFCNQVYGPFGFFTAAPGFVFISGLMAGIVYEKHRIRHGYGYMTRRILNRLRDLYFTQMILLLSVFCAVTLTHGSGRWGQWELELMRIAPWKALLWGASLRYEPGLLGLLPM